ncbi:MAG: ribonuclease III [Hyphomicrobiaceae bacterium]|nr:ribonuclease III [Hyphomicrobiaceae bacterium]MCC0008184.1 ribonuclease III [Hyphomicrobiaceae bacterium]
MALPTDQITRLEAALGYSFRDYALLEQALTHASVRGGGRQRADNERLEFIGDRVLALAIAGDLYTRHPNAREGELARTFNRMVRGETCAAIARSLDLGPCLILADSEASNGGRDKDTILADAIEAVLAAIFLEAGFERARAVVLDLWQSWLEGLPAGAAADAKSALQEWAQAQGLPLPCYREESRTGPDHAPRFVSRVTIDGRLQAEGEGASKRQAEQAAATAMLRSEGVWRKPRRE